MSALAQCDAFAFIYDQAGDPAPDVLVVLRRVIDAGGNPILLGPKTTVTDSAGGFHFTLPEFATAFISARASALWNCPDGRAFTVPPGPSGELVPDFSIPPSTTVLPPLVYVGDVLSIPKASATQDGYLSAADFVAFEAGAADMGITQINTGTGLTGGPITETGTISLAPISGVAGTWSNPTSITINAQGQIIAITATADTTAPSITAILATVTGTSVTITWTTDDLSDSQVDYGINTGYGTSTPLDTTLTQSHSVTISSLIASQGYHYVVKSRNTASLLTTSGDNTFTTGAVVDTTPPVITLAVPPVTAIADVHATINWTTNEAADSLVEYGIGNYLTSSGITNPVPGSGVTTHAVTLTGLTALQLYQYRVQSKDASGNQAIPVTGTFNTTATPDTTAPVITLAVPPVSPLVDVSATINWTTNEASDSQVEYSTDLSYSSATPVTNPAPPGTTTHAVNLSSLTASTTYNYRVKSKDAAGNQATPVTGSFMTTAAAPSTLLTGLRSYWKLDEPSGNKLDSITAAHNDLTSNGTATSVAGKVGNAVYSGSGGWLACSDNPSLDFTGKPLSIAGWMKIHSLSLSFAAMIGKWDITTTPVHQDFLLWYRVDTNQFEFNVTSNGTSSTAVAVAIGGPAILDQWYFVVALYDRPNNQIKISVDNGAFATATFAGPSIAHTAAGLGMLSSASALGDLTVDETGMWEKVLSTTEITSLAAGITYPF